MQLLPLAIFPVVIYKLPEIAYNHSSQERPRVSTDPFLPCLLDLIDP